MINTISSAIYSTFQHEVISCPKWFVLDYFKKNELCNNSSKKTRKPNGWKDLAPAFLIAGIAAPILEELIFRGAIQHSTEYLTGSKEIAVLTSSIIFSLVHYLNDQNPLAVVSNAADCYFLYNPLNASGGLAATMTAHSVHNCVSMLIALYTVVDWKEKNPEERQKQSAIKRQKT